MHDGELLTRITIWITMIAFAVGSATFALSQKKVNWDSTARWAWTAACLSLLAHVASAFTFFHGWSQDHAYRETARQTQEAFGLDWGGGLYVNYALLVLWTTDVIWWWLVGLEKYRRRPLALVLVWQALLIFIFFNATFVFATGFVRWAGLFMCLTLCVVWWLAMRNRNRNRNTLDENSQAWNQ